MEHSLTEVKLSECGINDSWQENGRIHLFLSALGVFPPASLTQISNEIKNNGLYEDSQYFISYYCLGKTTNPALTYPKIKQTTFEDVLNFIYDRFKDYELQKSSHPQWDNDGKALYDVAEFCRTLKDGKTEFVTRVNVVE